MIQLPYWVAHMALTDHRSFCPFCRNDRQDLCRDEEFTRELERATE